MRDADLQRTHTMAILDPSYLLELADGAWLRAVAHAVTEVLTTEDEERAWEARNERPLPRESPDYRSDPPPMGDADADLPVRWLAAPAVPERHAVLSTPRGLTLEARPAEGERNVRIEQGAAARVLDRARLQAERPDVDARMSYWLDLVSGRFSLVHHEDRDGRRYYVAVENGPATRALRALNPRERAIVRHAIAGASHKVTAHAIGITEPSVTRGLARALQKLGIPSRERLVDLAGRLGVTQIEQAASTSTHAA